jgi:drug/metabolite transporter (DMT)-like permease
VAVGLTAPGRATLLSNVYPLFVGLFGALLFGERLHARTALSAAICTAGAVLVMRDGSGAALAGDLVALAGALLTGIAINLVRKTSQAGADPFILYLSPCLFGLPIMAFSPMPEVTGGLEGILLLVAVGVGAFLAQALMAQGYRSVPAGRGSVIFYWETALTIVLGILLTGELVNARFGAGLVLILVGLWLNREPASGEGAAPA